MTLPNKVRTNLTVLELRPKSSKINSSDERERAMLRRARVPVALSDREIRAFSQPSPWRAIRFGIAWVGGLVLLYLDVYGFLALCNRMGWFGGAR